MFPFKQVDRIIFCVFLQADWDIYTRLMATKYFPCRDNKAPAAERNPTEVKGGGKKTSEQESSKQNSDKKKEKPNAWDKKANKGDKPCLLYTSPSPRDATLSRMPSSA